MSSQSSAKKDVIYVDIEDDITSIIDKVKTASASIVALVPPKRIGALQSVVNLKLLNRAADHAGKRIVMITNDHALAALAAGVAIPVAKNLQSKPEIAEPAPIMVDDDDVITGEEIAADDPAADSAAGGAVEAAAPLATTTTRTPRRGRASVIPDFAAFRNKAALIGGIGLALIVFLVWAIWFAPHATVTVTAKTTPYSVNKPLVATPDGTLDATAGTLKATVKEIKKSASADFTATGKKDVGEKATGQVKLTRQSMSSTQVPAGTELETSGGLVFVTTAAATIPASTVGPGCFPTACPGSTTVGVAAAASGASYNAASGNLDGAPGGATAAFVAPTGGGTDKTITVVTEEDAAAAREKIKSAAADEVKAELAKQFTGDTMVVKESFTVTPGAPSVAPAIGQEATTAKVTVETVYTMIGLARSDIRSVLEKDLTSQIGKLPNQMIYDSGLDSVKFTSYAKQDTTHKLNVVATGSVGPSINAGELAKKLTGKREGEIVQIVKEYEGIKSVDVRFSPFWVSTAPSADKITIKFVIENAKAT